MSHNKKKNVAVILAGGVGTRLGLTKPKQFYKVAGKMVVEHTVDAFEVNPNIDEIAIVANPMLIDDFEEILLRNHWSKVCKLLKGGKERYHSSLSAIHAYENEDVNLIFHDAVRPLVSQRIINDVCEALLTHQAVDVAIPSSDTIIEIDGDYISNIPDRQYLRRGQTPQAFDINIIKQAFQEGLNDPNFKATDDCGVVRKYLAHVPIYIVTGEESNIKLTYKEDTYLLDKLFQLRNTHPPVELSTDCHAFRGKVAVVFGGSYGIGKEIADMLNECGAHVHVFSRSIGNVDVAVRDSVSQALQHVAQTEGKIHYVINTAGILHRQALADSPYDIICNDINVNYLGAVHVLKEAYPYLKETHGALLLFTSSSYTRGRALYSIYSSTKAAIVNLVQAIAQEWDHDEIKVNCINPQRTDTPMRRANFGIEPKQSLLTAKAVAEAALNTLQSDYTGQIIDVVRQ